jgi:hypothetical protein
MPRGAPDWGEYAEQDLLIRTFDLGELAARLGCPSILERGGTVIFMDNFQDGYSKWSRDPEVNCQIVLSHKKTFAGGYSVRFAYSGQSQAWSRLNTNIPFMFTSTYGTESIILFDSNQLVVYTGLRVVINGYYYMFYFELIPATSSLYVFTPSGSVLVANDVHIDVSGKGWTFTKLISNLKDMLYWRVKINERSFDISNYQPFSGTTDEANGACLAFNVANAGSSACNLFIGSAIITINEVL